MEHRILLGVIALMSSIAYSSGACPTTVCTCTPPAAPTEYICNKKVISPTEFRLIIMAAKVDKIKKLTIHKYFTKILGSGTFKDVPLEELTIENSPEVKDLDVNAFQGLGNLKRLTISGTSEASLQTLIFSPLKATLTELTVKNNAKLSILPDEVFDGLTKLTKLDFTNNAIDSFSGRMFRDVKNANIDLSGNPVDCPCNSDTMSLMDLMAANAKDLKIICKTPAAVTGKVLKSLTKDKVCCPSTCTCTATSITCNKQNAKVLTEKDLTTTILPKVRVWDTVTDLMIMDYAESTLKAGIFTTLKITKLNIMATKLTSIDANAFKELRLVSLSISISQITTLPELVFSPLKGTLTELTVKNNPKLSILPDKIFDGLTKLTKLDFTNNAVTSFKGSMFNDVKAAKIDTTGNPVDCSCNTNTMSLMDLMATNTNMDLKTTCKTPAAVTGKVLKSLTKDGVCCPSTCTCTATTITCNKQNAKVTEKDLTTTILPKVRVWGMVKDLTITNYAESTLKADIFATLKITKLSFNTAANLKSIDANAFKGLILVSLSISSSQITTLPELVFSPLKGTLTQLVLNGNSKLTMLPVKIFAGLTKLTKLDLTNNALKSFTAEMFDDVKNAQILTTGNPIDCPCSINTMGLKDWLTKNPTVKLAIICKTPPPVSNTDLKAATEAKICPCPTTLCTCKGGVYKCDKKATGVTEQDLIKEILPKITTSRGDLQIPKYLGKELKAEAFKLAPNLERITIGGTALTSIDENAFKTMSALSHLTISGTSVATLPELLFAPIKGTLKEVDVTKNKLATIPPKTFLGLTKLTKLDLSNNALKSFSAEMFDDVKKAQILTNGNPIDCSCSINTMGLKDWLTKNPTVKLTIKCTTPPSVSNTDLKTAAEAKICPCPTTLCTCKGGVYKCDKKATGVTEQDLMKEILPKIKTSRGDLQIPKYLGKELKAEAFKLAPNLERITIGGTALTSINVNAFESMPALSHLTISGTSVTTLPEPLFSPIKGTLKKLFLTKNAKLVTIPPKIFDGLTQLSHLTISGTSMTTLPELLFSPIKGTLKELSLTKNAKLATIPPKIFDGLTQLSHLTISGTPMTSLPESLFSPLQGTLKELYVTKNPKLATIPPKSFLGLKKLTQLDLTENALKSFTAGMFTDVKQATINAADNPVDCSCNDDIKGLIKLMKDNPNLKLAIKCKTPSKFKDKLLKSLTEIDVCGPPTTKKPPVTTPNPWPLLIPDWALVIILAFIVALILVVIGIFCQIAKRRHEEKQWTNERDLKNPPEIEQGIDNQAFETE